MFVRNIMLWCVANPDILKEDLNSGTYVMNAYSNEPKFAARHVSNCSYRCSYIRRELVTGAECVILDTVTFESREDCRNNSRISLIVLALLQNACGV